MAKGGGSPHQSIDWRKTELAGAGGGVGIEVSLRRQESSHYLKTIFSQEELSAYDY